MVLEEQSLKKTLNFKNNPDLFFQFRLARDLGMTVGTLRTTMSNKEYLEWADFYIYENKEKNKAHAIAEAESKKRRSRR